MSKEKKSLSSSFSHKVSHFIVWKQNGSVYTIIILPSNHLTISRYPFSRRIQGHKGHVACMPTFTTPLQLYGWLSQSNRETHVIPERSLPGGLRSTRTYRMSEVSPPPISPKLWSLLNSRMSSRELTKIMVQGFWLGRLDSSSWVKITFLGRRFWLELIIFTTQGHNVSSSLFLFHNINQIDSLSMLLGL